MIPLYTSEQVRTADLYAINKLQIPGVMLMENAAISITESILGKYPYIDSSFRTNAFRSLWGQSNSGAFTFYSFIREPELFNTYFMSAPYGLKNFQQSTIERIDNDLKHSKFNLLGEVYVKLEDIEKAIFFYEKDLEIYPNNEWTKNKLEELKSNNLS